MRTAPALAAVAVLLAGLAVAPVGHGSRIPDTDPVAVTAAGVTSAVVLPPQMSHDLPRASRSFARAPVTVHDQRAAAVRRRQTTRQATPDSGVPAVWARVAACESGGDWRAATGNGFYGGLQFTLGTWRSHGGRGRPQNASPGAQVAVARRVLADQGVGAWPVCGPRAGLTRGD